MALAFPGNATQQQIEDRLLTDFWDRTTVGADAPVVIPRETAHLLLKILADNGITRPEVGEDPLPPVMTSLSPITTNTGSQNISVRGTGFTPQSKVVFDGTEMSNTVFKDAGWLQSVISGPDGVYGVFVRDTAGDSNAMQFTFK